MKYLTLALLAMTVLISLVNLIWYQKLEYFNSFSILPASMALFVLSFLELRKILRFSDFNIKNPLHWLFVANIICFGLLVQSIAPTMATMKIDINLSMAFLSLNYFAYAVWAILISIGYILSSYEK